jgi:hypothetical protein
MIDAVVKILSEARKYQRGCKSHTIYEYYKNRLTLLNLSPSEYELIVRQLAEILGV